MRTRFESHQGLAATHAALSAGLGSFSPELEVRPYQQKTRALILVTKESHCLRDLLYLLELGELPIEIPVVISNHDDLRTLVEAHGIPFLHLPITPETKHQQESALRAEIERHQIDVVVLARYMQVLSADFCRDYSGKIINIHHSFLPGFKGAKPYHQAHDRGVKIIGATAHFVTSDLDEGPIIEQDVAHVSHTATPEDMIALGRDIERRVLAKAVKLFAEDRIFVVGKRTVIF